MASSPSPDSSTTSALPPAVVTTPLPSPSAADDTPPPSSPPLETPSQTLANPPVTASPPPQPPPPTAPPPDPPDRPPSTTPPPESPPPPSPVTGTPTNLVPVTPTPSPPVTPPPPSDPPASPLPPVNPAPAIPVSPPTVPPTESPPPPPPPPPLPSKPTPTESPPPPPLSKPSPLVPPTESPPPPPLSSKPSPIVPPTESPPPPPPPKPTPSSTPPPPEEQHESSPPPPPSTATKSPPHSKVSPPPPTSKSPTSLPRSSPPASPTAPLNATTSPPPPVPTFVSPPSTPRADTAPSPVANLTDRSNSGLGTGGEAAIAVIAALIVLSIAVFAFWCGKKRRRKVTGLDGVYVVPSGISLSASSPKPDSSSQKSNPSAPAPLLGNSSSSDCAHSPGQPNGLGNSRPWFTYEELIEVTNGFSPKNLLGEGGFGSVYKGNLPDGREIAVKKLKVGGSQGDREFKSEVEIISRIHHRHLVSLVGYCIADSQRLLVYEYVPNNTLYFHLHGEGRPVLEWAKRVKIAAGAARGLAYLHEDCHPRVFHRDIKSSNILLDNNFEARVSDFGLAKLAADANTHVTTRVMGTFGYMAPEYALSGKLTEKSDVYSFGVVILELITGRKPVDTLQPLGDESLVEWARPLLSHALDNEDFEGLADPRLDKNYVESEMFRMIEVAAACIRHSAAKRPRMGQVVRAFDSLSTADLTNGMKVGESEVFNSAEQSAEIRLFRRMAFGSQDYSTDYFSRANSNI